MWQSSHRVLPLEISYLSVGWSFHGLIWSACSRGLKPQCSHRILPSRPHFWHIQLSRTFTQCLQEATVPLERSPCFTLDIPPFQLGLFSPSHFLTRSFAFDMRFLQSRVRAYWLCGLMGISYLISHFLTYIGDTPSSVDIAFIDLKFSKYSFLRYFLDIMFDFTLLLYHIRRT